MRVLLMSMPFGWASPSIGLGLLAAGLKRQGIASDVRYANLGYAARMGWKLFNDVCQLAPPQSLLGEWIFKPCLDAGADDAAEYLELYQKRFSERLTPGDAAALAGAAREAREWSGEFLEDIYASIAWNDYGLVGFTSSFHQTLASVALARMIKDRAPRVRTIMGGANCEGVMGLELHKAFPQIDFVCCGEADVSFPRLVRALTRDDEAECSQIPGVVWRENGESRFLELEPERVRDLDELPVPDYDDYFEQLAALPSLLQSHSVLMETSRGCWWGQKARCTFCGLNGATMTFRSKSPARVIEELENLQQHYAATRVEMVDNILDMRYFHTVLPEMKRRRLGIEVFYETKANLKEEQVQLLADAGVRRIQPGIESFSTPVLQLMQKGSTAAQNLQLLKWCNESGVQCDWNLLYGFPGETAEDYSETLALLDDLHHLEPPVACGAIRMDRFSPYYEAPEKFALSNVRPDEFYTLVFNLPPTALANLAYYFEFDYPASHDHSRYGAELASAVERWRFKHPSSSLSYSDDGKTLTVRFGGGRELSLQSTRRDLFLFCRHARSAKALAEWASGIGCSDLEAELNELLADGVVRKFEGVYLALPTTDRSALAPDAAQGLASKLARLSAKSSPDGQHVLTALRAALAPGKIT